ncbi:M24 family metallopeptidase [Nonomuraea sp. NPDC050478]|uniref:M24 family metallopeptidase n=1 Tax=Nonomuraea sp. NPDC050478 TaxID=3364365 RepID=UPI003795C599
MNIDRLLATMKEVGADAVLATSYPNVRYAGGFASATGRLYPQNSYWGLVTADDPERPHFVMPSAEIADMVDAGIGTDRMHVYGRPILAVADSGPGPDAGILEVEGRLHADPVSALRALLTELGLERAAIWVDTDDGGVAWRRLREEDVAARWSDGGADILQWTRIIKTPAEVEALRKAGEISQQALTEAFAVLGTGGTDVDVELAWRQAISRRRALPTFFMAGSGDRSAVFRRPGRRRASPGERFRWDCGLVVDGYCADTGGVVQVLAEPSPSELDHYRAVTAAVDAVLAAARPGVTASALYTLARDTMYAAGITRFRHSHVGHGIGVEARDAPLLAPAQPWMPRFRPGERDLTLREDMVLNVEVPFGILGEGGYQHELTFLVVRNGIRLLTRRHPYYVAMSDHVDEIEV